MSTRPSPAVQTFLTHRDVVTTATRGQALSAEGLRALARMAEELRDAATRLLSHPAFEQADARVSLDALAALANVSPEQTAPRGPPPGVAAHADAHDAGTPSSLSDRAAVVEVLRLFHALDSVASFGGADGVISLEDVRAAGARAETPDALKAACRHLFESRTLFRALDVAAPGAARDGLVRRADLDAWLARNP